MKFDKITQNYASRKDNEQQVTEILESATIIANSTELNLSDISSFSDIDGSAQPFAIDDTELDELIESMNEFGQITPITVRELTNGKYQILSGHKRCLAQTKRGKKTIEAKVIECSDKDAFFVVCNANVQRQSPKPTELYKMYKRYTEEFKSIDNSVTQIAKMFGVSPKKLYRCIHIGELIEELKPMVDSELLSINALDIICKLTKSQQKAVADYIKFYEDSINPAKAKKIESLSEQKRGFFSSDIDIALNTKKEKKRFKSSVFNSFFDEHSDIASEMTETELEILTKNLLSEYFARQKETEE